jgi:hypothetical protein
MQGPKCGQRVLERNVKKYNENCLRLKMACTVYYIPVSITSLMCAKETGIMVKLAKKIMF